MHRGSYVYRPITRVWLARLYGPMMTMAASTILFLLSGLAVQGALCCRDDYCGNVSFTCRQIVFQFLSMHEYNLFPFPRVGDLPSVNISLEGEAYFYLQVDEIDISDCPGFELHLEILRADEETELYTLLNETHRYSDASYPDRGLWIFESCYYYYDLHYYDYRYSFCYVVAVISPTDLRYDGAQITAILDLPECFNSSNSSDVMTLHIQGHFKNTHYVA